MAVLKKIHSKAKHCTNKFWRMLLCLNFSRRLLQIFHLFVCNFSREILVAEREMCLDKAHVAACNALNLFSVKSLVVKLQFTIHFFFQNSRFTEITRHQILIQTLQFLMWLPNRQDGFQNRDKAYFVRLMCVSLRSKQRQKDSVSFVLSASKL